MALIVKFYKFVEAGGPMDEQYEHLRLKARALRGEQGLSLDDIVARLHLPRSTVYGWIRDISIPKTVKQSEAQRRGTDAMQAKHSKAREAAYAEGWQQAEELLRDPTFRDFVVLYMAEGYKRNRNRVSVANSDAKIIMVVLSLVCVVLARIQHFVYRLQFHVDQNVDELREFWAAQLDISADLITIQRKSNSGKLAGRQWRSEWGVLTVTVNDTLLRTRLQAWMDFVQAQWP